LPKTTDSPGHIFAADSIGL